jgi:hypothetical protein
MTERITFTGQRPLAGPTPSQPMAFPYYGEYDENGVDVSLLRYMLSLSPLERLRLMEQHARDTQILLEYGRRSRETAQLAAEHCRWQRRQPVIELTEQQRQELSSPEPVAIDPETGQAYVLVRKETYDRLKALLALDDYDPDEGAAYVNEVMAEDDANDPLLESCQHYGEQAGTASAS